MFEQISVPLMYSLFIDNACALRTMWVNVEYTLPLSNISCVCKSYLVCTGIIVTDNDSTCYPKLTFSVRYNLVSKGTFAIHHCMLLLLHMM